jgi:ankyrin repeat protein
MTALHYAAKNGHAEVVRQLLAKGATQGANKVRPRAQIDSIAWRQLHMAVAVGGSCTRQGRQESRAALMGTPDVVDPANA